MLVFFRLRIVEVSISNSHGILYVFNMFKPLLLSVIAYAALTFE